MAFDVSDTDNPTSKVDCEKGLVNYTPGIDNSPNNGKDGDQYFNRITTPSYAHSYLLTSILSSDYQDIDSNGPSDNDLGSYTKFSYLNKSKNVSGKKDTYKWRIPYQQNMANYDEGLRSLNKDNKGNYSYGEKEMLYIEKIETKTHVAIFTLSERKDGIGVLDENGGRDDNNKSAKMWKLDKVSLYSKPEYLAHKDDLQNAIPIKEAHFVYDYALCKGVLNNNNKPATSPTELENQGGKLTLKKVYFTYRNSNMGQYTPYKFNYDVQVKNNIPPTADEIKRNNPNYDQKAYNIWGNYKPAAADVGCGTNQNLSNTEYPYVQQNDKVNEDKNASAWLLKRIDLPSGGKMELQYESDDYKYVQNKEVMQMFKVVGAGLDKNGSDMSNMLYNNFNKPNEYIYVKLEKQCSDDAFEFFYLHRDLLTLNHN